MSTAGSKIELTLRGRLLAWLAALAATAAVLGDDGNARLAAGLLAAPLLVDFATKQRRLHHAEVRVGPRRTTAGAAFTETVTVIHRGRSSARECLLVEPRTQRTEPPALLPVLAPDAPVATTLRARSHVRSHVVQRVFVLASEWPFGLFRSRAALTVDADLVTLPAPVVLTVDVVPAIAERSEPPRERTALAGPEYHSLREHLPGEDARGVHARRSAAIGTLVRRVTRGSLPSIVGVVLDLRRSPGRAPQHGSRRFEWGLGVCVTLVATLRARGAQVDVLVLGSEPASFLVRSPADEYALHTALAEAAPAPHRPLAAEAFARLRAREHSYWIAAGSHVPSPEQTAFGDALTVVGGDEP
jgi:hypothetical protein